MKQSTVPKLPAAALYEPNPLLAAALCQAVTTVVDITHHTQLPPQAPQGLMIIGGSNAAAAAVPYAATANILILSDSDGPADFPALAKPFRIGAFVDQVRRLCRRLPILQLGAARLYPQTRELQRANGPSVALTEKEVDILVYLAGTESSVSRDRLLEEVWGYNQGVSTHTLETHIYRLRQKIEDDPEAPSLLKTGADGYYLDLK